jgi:ATP-dependent Zn protease
MLVVTLIVASLGRSYITTRPSPDAGMMTNRRPIEITYSSFMDIVEQQQQVRQQSSLSPSIHAFKEQQQQPQAAPIATIPKIDKVKISTDRISFRLSRPSSSSSLSGDDQQQQQQNTYLSAFTRKPMASPELVQYFRQNNLEFTAASNQRNILLVYALRSAMATLYGLFLWRMYSTMRGASGQSSSDVPGKLLHQSSSADSRPLASFQDIQGIDDAKNEVMELVDTLRNPEKYAILGARAPTGLLLEGPPGTGKVSSDLYLYTKQVNKCIPCCIFTRWSMGV